MEEGNLQNEQMQEIRLGLESGVDVSVYAKPEFDWLQMEQIRMGLEEHVDVSQYAFCEYSSETMKQVRLAWHSFVDLKPYIEKGFEGEELEEIRRALEKELPIGEWIKADMYSYQIREIAVGLEEGLDVSFYANEEYSWSQMKEIRLGLERRVDVSWYAKPLMKARQMEEVRLGLEEGLDVSSYASLINSGIEMHAQRLALLAARGEAGRTGTPKETEQGEKEDRPVLNLILEEGGMKAYLYLKQKAALFPSKETKPLSQDKICSLKETKPPSKEEIYRELQKKGIVFGIRTESIEQIASGKAGSGKILIAEGLLPVEAKDGWYEFFVRTDTDIAPVVLPDGSVDYMGFEAFETVKAGQKLARYHPAEDGTAGKDVFGKEIPAGSGKEKPVLRGSGFILGEDKLTYFARREGRFEFENGRIRISNVVIIQEDVTGVFGKVAIDGSVHVRGNVHSGGYIEAAGDIIVDGNVEAARLKAGKDVVLKRGTCSKADCFIEAGGRVAGNFFEAAQITAGENVNANYLLNSRIKTLGKVIVSGRKGAVIGGRISAVKGIETYNIGNEADVMTVLDVGRNDAYREALQAIGKEKERILDDIRVFENGLRKLSRQEEGQERFEATISRLKLGIRRRQKDLQEIGKKLEELSGRAEKSEKQPVTVRGRAYAGTVVIIDGISYTLPQNMERIIFTKKDKRVAMVRL